MFGRFIIKILKHQNAGVIKNVKMIDFDVPFFMIMCWKYIQISFGKIDVDFD